MITKLTTKGSAYTRVNQDVDVIEASRARLVKAYHEFNTPVVSFSGGKDSTVLLDLTIEAARLCDRLPVKVLYFDEEIIDPDTLAYLEYVRGLPHVEMWWICVPLEHTLRSLKRSHWYPWDKEQQQVWFRPMPEWAVTELPGFRQGRMHYEEAGNCLVRAHPEWGDTLFLSAVRCDESLIRKTTILMSGSHSKIVRQGRKGGAKIGYSKPIYDWQLTDVWNYIRQRELHYSAYYDKISMYGLNPRHSRVSSWGNAASSSVQSTFLATIYPEAWARAVMRLPELLTQERYGGDGMMKGQRKPVGMTWQDYAWHLVSQFQDPFFSDYWTQFIFKEVRGWERKISVPFPEQPLSLSTGEKVLDGMSWKILARKIAKNDFLRGGR